ncbi:MAG: NAD(P)-binding protein [Candidatus Thermoplasmatota archaeon]|nr:NAD(P)-binding protein [Candidatus Thermoplasmatota archaeon]MBU1940965.1 NAD(P)-binding protein [Candidatus Thermoplasmatota archaeon]
MIQKTVDTIIVGAGVAGIGCANQLDKKNNDFLVISKDIGGRILTSDDGIINYGAFFVCDDYTHVLPWVNRASRIRLSDFLFHEEGNTFQLYEPRLIWYAKDMIRIRRLLRQFRRLFHLFRKKVESSSQKTVLEQMPWLYELYMMNAVDFVKLHHLERGVERYLNKGLYSTTFSPVEKMNAFSFLEFLLPLITPIYTFVFQKDKVVEMLGDRFIAGEVGDIQFIDGGYRVKTNDAMYMSKNVVLATEIGWSSRYAGVHLMNRGVRTCMMHVRGVPKACIARKRYQMFCSPSNVQAIADNLDGTFLFYYRENPAPLHQFFKEVEVIASHVWDPAGRIDGHTLIDPDRGHGLFLVGDYNIVGLEESYITGVSAANQIIQKS